MYKFIGSEYGKDKSDLEIIIESYEKAKSKGYIGPRKISTQTNPEILGDNSENIRIGRGRERRGGRGRRGGRRGF